MQEKVELIKADGETLTVDLISEFDCDVDGSPKRFVLLTANEIDQNGLIKILASSIVDGKLVRIESDDEWTLVKNVMRSIISSSKGDFTYANTSDNMSYEVAENYARVIAVQDSAKQALVNDYNEKKPETPEDAPATSEVNEDPNAAIYPTESETTTIGSEVVPGISEMTEDEEETEEESGVIPEVPSVNDEPQDIVTPEAPVVSKDTKSKKVESGDAARDELVNSIIAAVDKYLDSKSNKENNEVQEKIAKMQEELKKMTESLKA